MTCQVILFGEQFSKPTLGTRRHYSWKLMRPAAVHVMGLCNSGWLNTLSCHADELFYLFTIPKQTDKADIELSHQVIQAWVSFAKHADPGKMGTNTRWTEAIGDANNADPTTTSFMAMDVTSTMVHAFYKDTCENFWKSKIFV